MIISLGNSEKYFAVIGVTYPEGGVCTCSDGTKILKAKDTSGYFVFTIPSAGAWAISCVTSDETLSTSVTITTEGEAMEVALVRDYIFNNGVINETFSGGIYYPTLEEDAIYFTKDGISGGTNYTYTTKAKINLDNYTAIKAKFISSNTITHAFFRLGVVESTANGSSVTTSNMVANAREQGPFNSIERICTLDISEITGEYYLSYAFGVLSSGNVGNVHNRVYEWWLE